MGQDSAQASAHPFPAAPLGQEHGPILIGSDTEPLSNVSATAERLACIERANDKFDKLEHDFFMLKWARAAETTEKERLAAHLRARNEVVVELTRQLKDCREQLAKHAEKDMQS